jgi:TonB family protein
MKMLYKIALLGGLIFSAVNVFAQEKTELQKAIDLYRAGANDQAIALLEKLNKTKNNPDEAQIRNYLGLAYLEKNNFKKSRKALSKAVEKAPQNAVFRANLAYAYLLGGAVNSAQTEIEKAIALDPNLHTAYYIRGITRLREGKLDSSINDADRTIALNADFSAAYVLKSDALVAQFGRQITAGSSPQKELDFLTRSIEVLENCLKNCRNNPNLALQTERLEALKTFYDFFNREKTTAAPQSLDPADPSTRLNITYKPRASYTDQARSAMAQGKIVLAVLFAANGTVTQTIVIHSLGYGLDQEAVKAARGIRFDPLIRDGKPVSVVKFVEYSFSIY